MAALFRDASEDRPAWIFRDWWKVGDGVGVSGANAGWARWGQRYLFCRAHPQPRFSFLVSFYLFIFFAFFFFFAKRFLAYLPLELLWWWRVGYQFSGSPRWGRWRYRGLLMGGTGMLGKGSAKLGGHGIVGCGLHHS